MSKQEGLNCTEMMLVSELLVLISTFSAGKDNVSRAEGPTDIQPMYIFLDLSVSFWTLKVEIGFFHVDWKMHSIRNI